MSRPRVRLERAKRTSSDRWELDEEQAHHILHVRRCQDGDRIEGLWNGKILLLRLHTEGACLCGVAEGEKAAPKEKNLWLLLALLKNEAFERSLRMATECGADRIVPLVCERSVLRIDKGKWQRRRERWVKIVEESTRQARVPGNPVLYDPVTVASSLFLPLPESRFAALTDENSWPLLDSAPAGGAALAVGPEGDWSTKEKRSLAAGGFASVSLGTRIMTSPTAVAVGLGLLSMKLELTDEGGS